MSMTMYVHGIKKIAEFHVWTKKCFCVRHSHSQMLYIWQINIDILDVLNPPWQYVDVRRALTQYILINYDKIDFSVSKHFIYSRFYGRTYNDSKIIS